MANKRLQTISFFIIMLVVLILVILIIRPFIDILAFGIILTILFHPVFRWLTKKLKSETWAAVATVVLIFLIILAPVLFFGNILVGESIELYNKFKSGDLVLSRDQIIQNLPPQAQNFIENFTRDINGALERAASHAFESLSGILSNVTSFVISLFVLILTLYYLLRDGDRIKRFFMDLSPMADRQEDVLIGRIITAVNGVVKGSFLTALTQGVVATIGYFIFGIPEPIVWGLLTIIAALVPTVGTALVLVPAIVYLLITGRVPNAIGLTIWGAVAVGLIDNFLAPRFVGSRAKVHPLLVLLSVLGGLQFFGPIGFLLGPILMAIFVALVDMYRTDFKQAVEQ
jgi:predicted PurR-regulated permease PerM